MSTPANNPTNDETLGFIWVGVSFPLMAVTIAVVGVRLWWRMKHTGNLGRADICIILALAMGIAQLGLGATGILKWGFGHHNQYLGAEKSRTALMFFYLYQIPYKILVGLTKMSFLFLYLDIFTGSTFRLICNITNASVLAAMIAFTLTTVFQCSPIPYNWDKRGGGECIQAPPFWYAHAGWNSALDIFILILPIPVIKSLQMGKNQKKALIAVFALGAFVCVNAHGISGYCCQSCANRSDFTQQAFIWTQTESCVGIICACLPTLKAPLPRCLPRLFPGTNWSANSYNLDDVNHGGSKIGGRAAQWKDNNSYGGSKKTQDLSDDARSSQERIFRIKKTADVEVTRLDSERSLNSDHRKNQFGDRRV